MYVSKHPSPCSILRLLALVSNHNLWLVVPIVSCQLGGLDRLSHKACRCSWIVCVYVSVRVLDPFTRDCNANSTLQPRESVCNFVVIFNFEWHLHASQQRALNCTLMISFCLVPFFSPPLWYRSAKRHTWTHFFDTRAVRRSNSIRIIGMISMPQ